MMRVSGNGMLKKIFGPKRGRESGIVLKKIA
jgi:hypothetical protein